MPSDLQRQTHQLSLQNIAQGKSLAREALLQARNKLLDPHDPYGETNAQRVLHTHTLDYAEQIAPASEEVPDLWEETLYTATIPSLNGDTREILEERPVSLASLWDNWSLEQIEVTESYDHHIKGKQTDVTAKRLYLPVHGANAVYKQINDIQHALNIFLQVEAQRKKQKPGQPPEHIEWDGDGHRVKREGANE